MGRSLHAVGAAVLCPGPRARLRLYLVYAALVWDALRGRSGDGHARRLRITIGDHERDRSVADAMEVAALWEVFIAGEYGDWLPARVRMLVDGGANVGTATAWFRHRFPEARVVAVEPNPSAIERLGRKLGSDPNVVPVRAALSDSDGAMYFAPQEMSVVGRVLNDGQPGAVEVPALSLRTVKKRYCDGQAIDLLKLDIEGSEWTVLRNELTDIDVVALEAHDLVPDGKTAAEALTEVARRDGFELRAGRSPTMAAGTILWLVRPPTR